MTERRIGVLMIAAVALVAMLSYSITICRTVYWGDGIELTCVSKVLGIPHPPGYPLFALLGNIFAQIPFGSIAFRLNLMSAAMATILATLVAWIVWRLVPSLELMAAERRLTRALLGVGAGWSIASSQTFWYQAGLTEVYLLNGAVFAGVFLLLLLAVVERSARKFWAAALLTGVGAGNHTMVVLLIPALAVIGVWLAMQPKPEVAEKKSKVAVTPGFLHRLVRLALPSLLLGALGLCVYAYLPIRAAKNPPLNWGDPSSARSFLWVVRGGEFRNVFLLKAAPHQSFTSRQYGPFIRRRFVEWLDWTGGQFIPFSDGSLPPGEQIIPVADARLPLSERVTPDAWLGILFLFAAAGGWWLVARRMTVLAIGFLVVGLLDLAIVAVYNIPDIEGYFFPLHIIVVTCLFLALARFQNWAERRLLGHPTDLLAVVFLLLPAAAWFLNRSDCDHSHYDAAWRYGRQVLDLLPPNAMILTQGDYDIEPLWYQQIVEDYRRDVVVFGSNFLATPGYAKYFESRYDPPVKAQYFPATPREEEYFEALSKNIIAANISERPVYSTWYDKRMGVQAEMIDVPILRELETLKAPEHLYFPKPCIYRLYR